MQKKQAGGGRKCNRNNNNFISKPSARRTQHAPSTRNAFAPLPSLARSLARPSSAAHAAPRAPQAWPSAPSGSLGGPLCCASCRSTPPRQWVRARKFPVRLGARNLNSRPAPNRHKRGRTALLFVPPPTPRVALHQAGWEPLRLASRGAKRRSRLPLHGQAQGRRFSLSASPFDWRRPGGRTLALAWLGKQGARLVSQQE